MVQAGSEGRNSGERISRRLARDGCESRNCGEGNKDAGALGIGQLWKLGYAGLGACVHPERYYALGNREGYQDRGKKQKRATHDHQYRNADNRKAHDYGYEQGWEGQRGYHPETTDRH